jgi:hypothetical protein
MRQDQFDKNRSVVCNCNEKRKPEERRSGVGKPRKRRSDGSRTERRRVGRSNETAEKRSGRGLSDSRLNRGKREGSGSQVWLRG